MAKLLLPLAESSVRVIHGVGGFFVGSTALGGCFVGGGGGARVLNCRVGSVIFPNFLSS